MSEKITEQSIRPVIFYSSIIVIFLSLYNGSNIVHDAAQLQKQSLSPAFMICFLKKLCYVIFNFENTKLGIKDEGDSAISFPIFI